MRRAFAETLAQLARQDSRILLLTADLGFMALDPFSDALPGQFFNVGVAEQNMVGVATGLAEAGFLPFVYSIAPFATLRPFEFIRNGPVAHRLPVRVVGVGGGVEYGHNGISHYALEDVAVLRTQDPLTLICPCDAAQARTALLQTWNLPGPAYLRLGKDDRVVVPGLDGAFHLGRANIVHEGGDLLIIALGTAALEAFNAAQSLDSQGIRCTVQLVSSFNPAPVADVLGQLRRFECVMTVEAHYTTGGLGSWVCELAAENAIGCRVLRCGMRQMPDAHSGSQAWMQESCGFSSRALVKAALDLLATRAEHVSETFHG